RKSRISWESLPEENANLSDIDEKTIDKFKNLAKKRVPGIENEDTKSILTKLRLTDEKGKLKRAY
ncbi:MAG: transcriptional regulator, partial [Bacteroidota bacterium]|nr:transcriptional regulator [Bacteroidota bacterium]